MSSRKPVLVVTGGTRGIGAAVAEIALDRGWRVAVCSRRGLDENSSLANGRDERSLLVGQCDVTDPIAQSKFVESAVTSFGQLDAVVVSAAVNGQRGPHRQAYEKWAEVLNVNVLGAAVTTSLVLPHLQRSERGGSLVYIGSVVGDRISPGSMYSVSKASLAALAESTWRELRESGDEQVRVCLLELGWVDTEFLSAPRPAPLTPTEAAESVLYVLSRPPGVEVRRLSLRPTTQLDY